MIKLNSLTKKIAYIALFVAITVTLNYFYIPFGGMFGVSFVVFASFMAGVLLGPINGFIVGALADTMGCFLHGYPPNIFILLGSGMWGLVIGLFYKLKKNHLSFVLGAIASFVISSCLLNTYGLYTFTSKGIPFFTYLLSRLPVQLVNFIINASLAFFTTVYFEKQLVKKS